MKKYRSIPALIVLVVAMIFLLNPTYPKWIGLALLALAAFGVIFASRGTFTFSKANRIISQRKPDFLEKALPLYEKAVEQGIPEQYQLVAGTLMIQYGNMEKGKAALEELFSSKDKKMVFQAKEGLSMYYWINKDTGRAIKLCEEAKEMGFKDKNLYINLGTYYLAKNRIHEFKLLMKESYKLKLDSPALVDMQAASAMLQGDYKKAGNLLKTIFDKMTPSYVDPFVHYAMVYLHYGEKNSAIEYLEKSLEVCSFANTSILSKDEVVELIIVLKSDDFGWAIVNAINENPLELINGKIPSYKKLENKKASYAELPAFKAETINRDDISERDENEPDTSLTDEDEEWLKKHNN